MTLRQRAKELKQSGMTLKQIAKEMGLKYYQVTNLIYYTSRGKLKKPNFEDILPLWRERKNVTQIARHLDCMPHQVYYQLKKRGIQ